MPLLEAVTNGLRSLRASIRPSAARPKARQGACRVVTTSLSARLLLREQLDQLDDLDWSVVSGDDYPDLPAGVEFHLVPMRRELALSDGMAFVRLFFLFRRRRFEFVQVHMPKSSLLALPAARLTRTPCIYTVHGAMYFKDNDLIGNVAGWLFERWCCSWANQVLVQSREDLDVLARARICPRRKLSYIGNGIALERFIQPVTPALRSDRPVVMMVSRLVQAKGCRDFFALAAALRDVAAFVHVGPDEPDQRDGIGPDEVAGVARRAGVRFIGSVTDVRPFLAAADVVVLPSYREGIPRAVMEAAAMGRPVVAYDTRGVREVIPPETDLLIPRGDVTALVARVRQLLVHEEQRSSLGRRCQEWILSTFSEDDVVGRLREVYQRLNGRG